MSELDRLARVVALVIFGVALAGCGPGGAWIATMVAVLALVLGACSESREATRDAGVAQDARVVGTDARVGEDAGRRDAEVDAGGSWDTCCNDGRVDTCFCPGGASCNYGLGLVVCADGRCTYDHTGDPELFCSAPDGGLPDAGEPGEWERCCNAEGRVDLCFCPAGAVCNYGLFEDCGEGYCASPPGSGCPG
ncbi:hypothetical protein [Sandaracinus amylolyticus]|uniref:Uncharacterized protein n=1 Tax=Sandaracinus amylolyticus TaxID=927083 RepID=A0A0F6YH63_9BACT|nr:hypothetical protein [Sandaracinus amylolyticus]AKF04670.1 hypothetical protein DB32_001819 [Sandaracinus amylolyticus]